MYTFKRLEMNQDFQFCYSAPSLRIVEVSMRSSILGESQIKSVREDNYGEF